MDLVLNDPVAVTLPGGDADLVGVYWVRIYRRVDRAVVIIADVPGNPGMSPTNGASVIALHLVQEYLAGASRSAGSCAIRAVIPVRSATGRRSIRR